MAALGAQAIFALLEVKRNELGFDPSKSSLEALGLVDFTDGGFDGSGFTEGSEELIGSQLGECFGALGGRNVGLLEDPLTGKEGEDGVANPCLGAFFLFILRSGHVFKEAGLMCLDPVVPDADFDFDGAFEGEGLGHILGDDSPEVCFFVGCEVKDEFVVDLEEEARVELGLSESLLDADHGEFDHIGGGTLNGHIDGVAFGGGTNSGVTGIDIREGAASTATCFDIALIAGKFFLCFHVAGDAGELREVSIDDFLSLGAAGIAESLGEAIGGDAVWDAEVDHFCGTALFAGDGMGIGLENFSGGGGVDILSLAEGGQEALVLGEGGKDSQFDL